ncbi:hypothetical protein IT774_14800 [Salinimonas marina]|uniref:beta-N-acetylhexosaminidase n=1 Tax=Salinimonas marina TaxID=2785918 RepID=A0A7S9HDA5_9ALTE|nr:glycoside hydrolase family 3 protein [Salinimonas marina]QPG05356.1 hypothetical protein IT774_14800 [Salinimonas marina]
MLGQKMILDLRYYCADDTPAAQCCTPVTRLTDPIKKLLVSNAIGGVILFGQNIENTRQLVTLNYELQQLMQQHDLPPLFIAIDQEGGRVARIPDHMATRFVGNMAIGATHSGYQTHFAAQVGASIAETLNLLGFNINFAPSVDVNSNPLNPVINVRSYGEAGAQVAALGDATVKALQSRQIISALKHFPGHGDTHTDSHSGLPRVNANLEQILRDDLLPFIQLIDSDAPPQMIMTAHIQYPALDDTRLATRDGGDTVVPATLSEKILTGLLRNKLNYNGLIVTDAMDMAGIAQFFSPAQALIQTYAAGADIALMPFSIRNTADTQEFERIQQQVMAALNQDVLSRSQMQASARHILQVKQQYHAQRFIARPLAQRLQAAQAQLPSAHNRQLEQQLANAALTVLQGQSLLPLANNQHISAIMPDTARCQALAGAVSRLDKGHTFACRHSLQLPAGKSSPLSAPTDILLVADISPPHTAAETGGMDSLAILRDRSSQTQRHQWLKQIMQQAQEQGITTVFAPLRAPYIASEFAPVSDIILATFGYNVDTTSHKTPHGAVFEALASGVFTDMAFSGTSPVSVRLPPAK